MKLLKQKEGVMVNVRNNIITLARGFLCFFTFEIFVGFLWVGSTLSFAEYLIWTTIGILFIYSIIVTSPSYDKNYYRKSVVCFGLLAIFSLFLSDGFYIFRWADVMTLAIVSLPFVVLHYLAVPKDSECGNGCSK